jgi:hypothetical protein
MAEEKKLAKKERMERAKELLKQIEALDLAEEDLRRLNGGTLDCFAQGECPLDCHGVFG